METALDNGLVKKYGGFATANELPDSPTWRFQSGGNVQVGDPCNRRGIFGGLSELNVGSALDRFAINSASPAPPYEISL